MMKLILPLIVIAILSIAGCGSSERAASVMGNRVEAGSPAPDFTLRGLDGGSTSLSDHKGKVVLLNFWKMRCDECMKVLSSIDALNRRFEGRGFVVLAINADNMEYVKPEKVRDFMGRNRYTFNVLLDETFFVSEMYKIIAVPMTYLIDKEGVVSHIWFGEGADSIERIEKLLGG